MGHGEAPAFRQPPGAQLRLLIRDAQHGCVELLGTLRHLDWGVRLEERPRCGGGPLGAVVRKDRLLNQSKAVLGGKREVALASVDRQGSNDSALSSSGTTVGSSQPFQYAVSHVGPARMAPAETPTYLSTPGIPHTKRCSVRGTKGVALRTSASAAARPAFFLCRQGLKARPRHAWYQSQKVLPPSTKSRPLPSVPRASFRASLSRPVPCRS